MKRIVSLAVISAVLIGGGLAIYHFSGARGKVMKKNIEDKIDDLLGKDKVRQQEIADALEKANLAVDTLFDGRVREQVRVERLTKEVKPIKSKYEASDRKLGDMITAVEKIQKDPTVEVSVTGDTKYSQKNLDELKAALAAQTKQLETVRTELTDKQRALTEAERSFTLLKNQELDARQKVSLFTARKKALDAKMEALTKQQEAAKLLRAGKSSAGDNFDELEKKLGDLEDHAEVEFRKAEEHSVVDAKKSQEESKGGSNIDDVLRAAREARGEK